MDVNPDLCWWRIPTQGADQIFNVPGWTMAAQSAGKDVVALGIVWWVNRDSWAETWKGGWKRIMSNADKRKWGGALKKSICFRCHKVNRTERVAVLMADDYCRQIPPTFQFGEMDAYFCHYAQSWHVGHRGKKRAVEAARYRIWGECDPSVFNHIFARYN